MGIAKWLLTGLGWSVGGPIGAIIGYILGKSLSSEYNANQIGGGHTFSGSNRRGPYHNTGTQGDVNAALLVLMADVMKADGVVMRSELDYVKAFLSTNYGEAQAKELLLALRDMTKRDIPIDDVCYQIKTNTDYTTRYHMVDFLFGIAGADGDITAPEERELRTISVRLGINTSDYLSIHERHLGGSYRQSSSHTSSSSHMKDPYKVLGIESSATDDEVKKAYRRMAMKYHPDKVEGMGEEVKKNAEAQFREINEAYETIKNARGMK